MYGWGLNNESPTRSKSNNSPPWLGPEDNTMIETSADIGTPVATSPFSSVKGAADAAQDAGEGARFLTEFWTEQGVCFTSGHIVSALREARGQSLMINQRPTGQATQDYFTSGDAPSYGDDLPGDAGERPMRKLRYTERSDTRTPVGTGVFVYGRSEDEIDAFEFEINIADAPMVDDGKGGQTSAATALLNATPNTPAGTSGASLIPPVTPSGKVAVANGKMVPGRPLAVVHSRGGGERLTIPRIAFEALAFETGEPVIGGQPVYVNQSGDLVTVSQNANGGGVAFKPTSDRLRLHLNVPNIAAVGTEYEILISGDGLTIDLSNPE